MLLILASSTVATDLLQTCFSFFVRLLSCLVAVSSLSFLSNSFSSPRYNLLRMAKRWFLWSSVSFSRLILSLSFLCSTVYEALFALSFSFLSERFSSVHAKAALAYSQNENTGVTGRILPPNTDFEHARVWPTQFRLCFLDHDRHNAHYWASEASPTLGCSIEISRDIFIGERAKRARHSQVCSIENRGYI